MPSTWASMTSEQQDAALAEKLGWNTTDLAAPYGGIDVWWIDLARERGDQLICRVKDFDVNTWPGMGLVVEAMAAKGFDWSCNKGGRTKAAFVNHDYANLITVSAYAETPPAATAEAAWRALGGE